MRTLLLVLLLASCAPFDANRSLPLRGLNVFPHAATPEAVLEAVDFAVAEADVLAYLEVDENPVAEAVIAARFAASGKPVFVAVNVTPGRDHMARCRELIELFEPDYFCYAIEANQLDSATQALLPQYYAALKAENPALPVFLSVQTTMGYDQAEAEALIEFSDYWAISTYAYLADGTFRMPPMQSAPFKPVVIAETGWPADPLDHPVSGNPILTSEQMQANYVRLLRTLPVKFFVWYVSRDYDQMWADTLDQSVPSHRWFRDTGLLDGDGNPRLALEEWRR